MVGRQEHSKAVVVSKVVQNVIGMLSQVGSAVRPKVLMVYSRTIEVTHTLEGTGKMDMFDRVGKFTHKPPSPNMM